MRFVRPLEKRKPMSRSNNPDVDKTHEALKRKEVEILLSVGPRIGLCTSLRLLFWSGLLLLSDCKLLQLVELAFGQLFFNHTWFGVCVLV